MISTLSKGRRRRLFVSACVLVVLATVLLVVLRRWSAGNNTIVVPVQVPLSGDAAGQGREVVNAVTLYFKQVNQAGGINGRQLRVQPYDDALDNNRARQNAQTIINSDALAVIGHLNSSTSTAASPIYQSGKMVAITGAATADPLTIDNPYYFRTVFNNSEEGASMAAYAHEVLGLQRATVIYSDEPYGQSLKPAFEQAFIQSGGTVSPALVYEMDASRTAGSLNAIVASLAANPNPGAVFLAVTSDSADHDIIVAVRRAGLNLQFLGGDSTGGDTFSVRFRDDPEDKQKPGYFIEGMYAGTPILFDSANNDAQTFAEDYQRAYGIAPGWEEAKFYDAAHVLVEALRKAQPRYGHQNVADDRARVYAAMGSFNSPSAAIATTTGSIYFDARRSVDQPVRLGQYLHGRFVSASDQLEAVSDPNAIDVKADLADGLIVAVGDQYAWKQRVVYTGIDINQISAINQSSGTFTADLYLWFRYSGNDDVLSVQILNATDRSFDPKSPLASDEVDGLHHKLYRVRGTFNANYDFHDYPFDRQNLPVQVQNLRLSRSQVIYAVDEGPNGLKKAGDTPDNNPVSGLSSWQLVETTQYQVSNGSNSSRGYDASSSSDASTQYSTRVGNVAVQRLTMVFLTKSLLPLFLLALGVFTTLFFPFAWVKDRLTLAISAMLAAAVLLVAINSSVSAGYTMAIEYFFYAFFALCLYCIVVALVIERLVDGKTLERANQITYLSRGVYVIALVGVGVAYLLVYGGRVF
jgi:ABC-type branched-subunit amino acid transport system substrate-binding protein